MKNWNTNIEILKKDPEKYAIWRLEQLINFGLDGEKISEQELKKYWDKIQVDPSKKAYLKTLLSHA